MTVAIVGYYLFSPAPSAEMTLDFDTNQPMLRIAVFAYVIQLMMSYVIVLFIVYSSVEHLLIAHSPATFGGRRGRCALRFGRLASVALASVIAVVLPNFGDFISL